jgi:sugar O-acyltransferase (sialic acid O-acetyltransferase NeuD family)
MKNLIIWGSGGHGRVVLDIALAMGTYERIAFYDDHRPEGQPVAGLDVISGGIVRAREAGFNTCVIAIGPNTIRAAKYDEAVAAGLQPATCIHPAAWVSPRAQIGAGTVVMPRAVVQTDAVVGINCILNTGVIVEHDCRIGAHAHLSPSVTLSGTVTVGSFAHMGTGAIAIPGVCIGDRAVVGAGAVVLRPVEPGTTVAGVPAHPLRSERTPKPD